MQQLMSPTWALSFDWRYLLALGERLLIAYLLTVLIGQERGRDSHSAGLRTFPLVSLASCAYVLLAIGIFGASSADYSRVLQGLVTAVGFIGGGAIIKDQERVRGTATAAGIWATSAIGAAVGFGQLELAVLVAVLTYLTLVVLRRFELSTSD